MNLLPEAALAQADSDAGPSPVPAEAPLRSQPGEQAASDAPAAGDATGELAAAVPPSTPVAAEGSWDALGTRSAGPDVAAQPAGATVAGPSGDATVAGPAPGRVAETEAGPAGPGKTASPPGGGSGGAQVESPESPVDPAAPASNCRKRWGREELNLTRAAKTEVVPTPKDVRCPPMPSRALTEDWRCDQTAPLCRDVRASALVHTSTGRSYYVELRFLIASVCHSRFCPCQLKRLQMYTMGRGVPLGRRAGAPRASINISAMGSSQKCAGPRGGAGLCRGATRPRRRPRAAGGAALRGAPLGAALGGGPRELHHSGRLLQQGLAGQDGAAARAGAAL